MNVTKIYQYPKKKTITKGEPYVIFGQKVTKFIEELLILIEEKTGLKLSFVMMNLRFGGIIIKNEKEDKEERWKLSDFIEWAINKHNNLENIISNFINDVLDQVYNTTGEKICLVEICSNEIELKHENEIDDKTYNLNISEFVVWIPKILYRQKIYQ